MSEGKPREDLKLQVCYPSPTSLAVNTLQQKMQERCSCLLSGAKTPRLKHGVATSFHIPAAAGLFEHLFCCLPHTDAAAASFPLLTCLTHHYPCEARRQPEPSQRWRWRWRGAGIMGNVSRHMSKVQPVS